MIIVQNHCYHHDHHRHQREGSTYKMRDSLSRLEFHQPLCTAGRWLTSGDHHDHDDDDDDDDIHDDDDHDENEKEENANIQLFSAVNF